MKFLKSLPLTKVDEKNHVVNGLSTAEVVDKAGEIADYDAMVPQYQAWSSEASGSTIAAGQEVSLGNIRLMHGLQIAGKATGLTYNDDAKQVLISTEPSDESIWRLIRKGMIRGFSQAGQYIWRKCEVCGEDMSENDKKKFNFCPSCNENVVVRYAATIQEVSYVDNPCLGVATFDYIKADGTSEVRKFADVAKEGDMKKSMYSISRMADLLGSISYLRDDAKWEGEYEEDESDYVIAEGLDEWLKQGIVILKQIVENETSELVTPTAKAATGKGTSVNKDAVDKSMLKRAAGMSGHFRKSAAYHEKKADLHKSLAEHHTDMMEACKTAMEGCSTAMKAAEGDDKEPHKAALVMHKANFAFHKGMAATFEKMAKLNSTRAELMGKAADSAEEEAEKEPPAPPKKEADKAVPASDPATSSATDPAVPAEASKTLEATGDAVPPADQKQEPVLDKKFTQEDLDKAVADALAVKDVPAVTEPPVPAAAQKTELNTDNNEGDTEVNKEEIQEMIKTGIASGIEEYMKKQEGEKQATPPAGLFFSPRPGMGKSASAPTEAATVSDDEVGL